ncbi:LacI family transcriptional regulator [Sphingobacterium sp. SGG-5]|uniref:LacI family DNA-binding transcriptional regulator n=1 Tax=Sphingobacterium sp. SGG-5 TaxID=2710881 RepID=UPI0013EAD65D|nr:LacI family DNA-binding transcriptional regulator [Sphingobacterium sp. SGG-5]NGM61058.1 LacI family transcriptional regulator [Sphingobacterium sp. SGG-5]
MKKHQVTIIDIAKNLGISKSTVSRALTNNPNVSAETRKAVLEMAKSLDYQPNMLALSLIKNETRLLGVIIPDIQKPFFAAIVSGIQHAVGRMGYRTIIAQSDESPQIEKENIQALMLSRVDGFLICHTRDTRNFDHVKTLYQKGFPLVSFARICQELPIPKVVEDDFNGLYTTTQHLIETGRRRIALLAGPKHMRASKLRQQGYMAALRQNGITYDQDLVEHTRFLPEHVTSAVHKWLALPKPPDAICTIYDAGGIQIIQLLKNKGIRIPEDIAVAGFGNDPVASLVEPGLTTFEQRPYEIGLIAGKQMLDTLKKKFTDMPPEITISQGKLIVRSST